MFFNKHMTYYMLIPWHCKTNWISLLINSFGYLQIYFTWLNKGERLTSRTRDAFAHPHLFTCKSCVITLASSAPYKPTAVPMATRGARGLIQIETLAIYIKNNRKNARTHTKLFGYTQLLCCIHSYLQHID